MRKMRSSGNASWRTAFNCSADARSRPNGFSTTTRPRRLRPTLASDWVILGNAVGGMAR